MYPGKHFAIHELRQDQDLSSLILNRFAGNK